MTRRGVLLVLASVAVLCGAALVGPSLDGPRGAFIFWSLRVPRVLVGALVGGTLGLTGAVFQAIFVNPLATPSTVGTTAGATLGALAALVLGASAVGGLPVVVAAAFAGALAASAVVSVVAARGSARIHDVLLVGIAVTLAAGALSTGLQYTADMSALFASAQWSLGHLPQVGYRGVLLMAPFVVISTGTLLSLARELAALVAGEELAQAQGVDVRRTRTLALGLGSLGVAACVAWCGPIAFVGLLVPHLVRLLVGATERVLLPLSLVVGAAFLVGCDALARVALPGRDLPVGVVTAALGAPALIVLIARARRT
ncbi:MAG: iron ABC transporter permease [Sorangiineae bacterium]|nr:iron ABC transporter permease [Polyangiaceae bacterium]MEB2322316.1 iron ABC transporter permease [Sorangiineae bacterium]